MVWKAISYSCKSTKNYINYGCQNLYTTISKVIYSKAHTLDANCAVFKVSKYIYCSLEDQILRFPRSWSYYNFKVPEYIYQELENLYTMVSTFKKHHLACPGLKCVVHFFNPITRMEPCLVRSLMYGSIVSVSMPLVDTSFSLNLDISNPLNIF